MDLSEKILSRLKLRQLRVVVAIDDYSSLRGAAEFLGLSQPAITKTVQELEADFGITLFDRTNRGVVATDYGEALIKHARLILAQVKHAGEELSDLAAGHGGRVVVGTLVAAAASIVPQAIVSMRAERPNSLITVVEGTNDRLIPALLRGDLDLMVGRLPEFRHREGVVHEALYDEEIVLTVRPQHPLAKNNKVTLKMLLSWDWILPPPETTLRRQIEKTFGDHNLTMPRCNVESVTPLTNRQLLKDTDMIGVFPAFAAREDIDAKALHKLPVTLQAALGPVGITTRRDGRLPPVAHAFIDELRAVSKLF